MKKTFLIVWDAVKNFNRHNCFTSAAAISYYAFFSLIPLMLIISAVLGFVLGTRAGLLDKVILMVKENIPYLSDSITVNLKGLSRTWKTFGWLGVLSLISSAELVLGATADALSAIFGTTGKHGFLKRKIINMVGLLLAILASLLSISLTAFSIILKNTKVNIVGIGLVYRVIQSVAFKFVLPFLVVAIIVAVVYKLISGSSLTFRFAMYGSILFSLLWEAAKQLFAWYVSNFPSYNKFYGSLGAIMVLLIWIFYSSNIFLFSAAVAKAAYDRSGGNGRKRGKR